MIREFWVENYLSIAQRQGLNFVAKDTDSVLVTQAAEGEFLYKLGIMFGPNASGKSNMLLALNQIFSLLVTPRLRAEEKDPGEKQDEVR